MLSLIHILTMAALGACGLLTAIVNFAGETVLNAMMAGVGDVYKRQVWDVVCTKRSLIGGRGLYRRGGRFRRPAQKGDGIPPGPVSYTHLPSGSGKSTFLRCLNLLEEPTGGQIVFEGVDITSKAVSYTHLDVYKRQGK